MTNKLPEFNARILAQLNEDKLWEENFLPEKFLLVFDDGAFETTRKRTIFSWYSWWPHRLQADTPMLAKYHIGNNVFTGKTINALMEMTAWDFFDYHKGTVDKDTLALYVKQEFNHFYNSMTYRLEEYVTSIDAEDYAELMFHPEILEITNHLQSLDLDDPGQLANIDLELEKAYNKAEEIMMNNSDLKFNRLVQAVKTKIVDIRQLLQCVIAVGSRTETDSHVFPRPIVRGFGHGLINFHDVFIESCSSKKALSMAKTPLAIVEYFNRQQQLSSETLSILDDFDNFYSTHGIKLEGYSGIHDCGSKEYIPWKVDANNLRDLDGLYHWKDDGTMELIKPWSTHLIGKLIRLRTVLTCRHPDPHSICPMCFGQLSENIPYGTNVAHMSSVTLCSIVSQNVLSTKHLDGSATLDALRISNADRRFIREMPNHYEIALSSKINLESAKIYIMASSNLGIGDIYKVENLSDLVPSRVTMMSDVIFETMNEFGGLDYTTIPVSMGSRMSSFTTEFLGYIKEHGYDRTDDGFIVISLKDVPYDMPVWTLPRKHANMLEFMGAIEKLIKSSDKNKAKSKVDLTDYNNLSNALSDFYDLVNPKFNFNISHLAVILRTTMVRSKKNFDYNIPNSQDQIEFAPFNAIMKYRSLSAWAPFEKQSDMYLKPQSYLIQNRARHPMDEILIPTPGLY